MTASLGLHNPATAQENLQHTPLAPRCGIAQDPPGRESLDYFERKKGKHFNSILRVKWENTGLAKELLLHINCPLKSAKVYLVN